MVAHEMHIAFCFSTMYMVLIIVHCSLFSSLFGVDGRDVVIK